MKLMKFFTFFLFLVVTPLHAEMISKKKDGAIFVDSATTSEIEELFKQQDFTDFSKIRMKFPRIYMKKLPSDWKNIEDNEEKHKTFIRIMIPLVLKVNEEILKERILVENIFDKYNSGEKLTEDDKNLIEQMAIKYDAFTRLKTEERMPVLIKMLLDKVDVVPLSLMISTAGIYTNWGSSRFAIEGNALYLEELWYQNEGMKPLDDENAEYRYKAYNSLEECIYDKALKLNTHINYDYFREARRISRTMKRPPYGAQLAAKMLKDSNLQNIAGMIDYTFSYYHFVKTDYFPELRDVK